MQIPYKRPFLFPKQKAFIDDPARFTYIEAGTKSGKTIGMIIWLHEQMIACEGTNKSFWWVAPYYTTTKIAFYRWWDFIPLDIRHMFSKKETELIIKYPGTEHKVYFKSADNPDTLYGEDVHAVVMDEASRQREEAWNAVRTTLTATKGRGKIIGNLKGRKNWFYRDAKKAKANGIGYHFLTSYDNPYLDPGEIKLAKKNLPEHVFNELFLSKPMDEGANPFGIDYIRNAIKPLSNEKPVCFGIDLAKYVDWTVIIGLDENKDICFYERFQKDWKLTREVILNRVEDISTLIDCTGVGDPIVEDLQRNRNNIEGLKFTASSKQQLMEGLASDIQKGNISILEGVMQDELESFEFIPTRTGIRYSAPTGQHDNCCVALALANKIHRAGSNYGEYALL